MKDSWLLRLHAIAQGFTATAALATPVKRIPASSDTVCSTSNLPENAWDSHLHIIDPVRFPFLPDAEYNTSVHGVWENVAFENRIGCEHVVFIQPSVYGDDNALLIEALEAYGPSRARGVVVFDVANTTQDQLRAWHELGVRGVRINLLTHNTTKPVEVLRKTLQQYADAVRPFGWVMQLYVAMPVIASLEDFIPTLEVPVVFDHFGAPTIPTGKYDPSKIEGFPALIRILKSGHIWVKVSGAYRLSKQSGPTYTDLDPIIRILFREAPSRLVYGSDWPHTRFEGLDIRPWVEHLVHLTKGNATLRDLLFVKNAEALWGEQTESREKW